jgi:hypothetical protein
VDLWRGFPKSHNISKGLDKAAGVEREVLGIARMQPDIRGNNYAQGQREYGGDTVPQYITKPATDEAKQWEGWGTALKPAHEPMVLARKPLIGTVAANVLTYGTGGLNIDGARVGSEELLSRESGTGLLTKETFEGWRRFRRWRTQYKVAVGPPMSSTMAVTRLWRCFLMQRKWK